MISGLNTTRIVTFSFFLIETEATMYSIYVTNKTGDDVYIRLQHEKISVVNPSFHHELDKLTVDKAKDNVNSYLVRWGFCIISPQQTIPFPIDVENDGPHKYASLFAKSKLWTMDHQIHCIRYGCLFVEKTFLLKQANPKPVWIPANKGDVLSSRIVKVGAQTILGRHGSIPCSVTVAGGKLNTWVTGDGFTAKSGGELLLDTGHEFLRSKAGDLVPPHAVITGVTEPEGSLYLGRVGVDIPCSISTEGGKIKSFYYGSKKVQSGEILVLTP